MTASRYTGARVLADLAAGPLKTILSKAGFAVQEVVERWDDIVGAELGRHTAPVRIAYPRRPAGSDPEPGVLHVRVETPFVLEVQHLSGAIVERVNAYFGWRCVATLKIQQVPMKRSTARPSPAAPPVDEERLRRALEPIEDAGLRQAIERLGRNIAKS